uniref:UPAR/Ly6 domain-containing protein n=1 Tax=Periophthalmus magnuspinnatus TaxID=409849 RepID=A0A3B4BJW2_9GOBI
MLLHILIIGLVLCPQAHTLKCMECSEDKFKCFQLVVNQHQNLRIFNLCFAGSSNGIRIAHRSCATTHECFQYSIHFLQWRSVITTKCCKSNLCNSKDAPDPPKAAPNGLKCFSCDNEGACNKTLNCVGDEDHCLEVLGERKTRVCSAVQQASI